MEWYTLAFKKFAEFTGRSRRKEYWMFMVINFIISMVFAIIDIVAGPLFIGTIYSLVVLIPSLALSVRRLHDTGKSGWMILISLIPLVGVIWLIILFATEGDYGPNQYGPDPKRSGESGNEDSLDGYLV